MSVCVGVRVFWSIDKRKHLKMLKRLRAQAKETEKAKAQATVIDVETGESGPVMDGADIRLSKDLSEIYLPPQCSLTQVNGTFFAYVAF